MRKDFLEFLKTKYVFFDFDGTLCEFRYCGKAGYYSDDKIKYDDIFGDIYKNVRPLKSMNEYIKNLDPNRVFILGAICTGNEVFVKLKWLSKHFPTIKPENVTFISDASQKDECLEMYTKKLNCKPSDIVFVDDKHNSVYQAEDRGFNAFHISSFID